MRFSVAFYLTHLLWIATGSVLLLAGAAEIGLRLGVRSRSDPESVRSLIGGIGATTLGLLGLLLGFSLSMAIGRFDARRAVIVQEANAIGTLWLRAGLIEEPMRSELRALLREYVAVRIDLAEVGADLERLRSGAARSEAAHVRIWAVVERVSASEASPAVVSALVAAANEVIDLHETRRASVENFVPAELILMLIGIGAVALGLLGWSFGASSYTGRTPLLLLIALLLTVILLILDLNRPHRGTIRVPYATLERVQRSMVEPPP